MDLGQELTHTVTTTITSDRQTILNETKLVDGAETVLETKYMVSLETGKTYEIEAKGDINGQTIRRTLNVVNNLLGSDAFNFKDSNGATDGGLVAFTAQYDAILMQFTGKAPVGSVVRIVFEDGRISKVEPSPAGEWELFITADQLQYGMNNIIVINGTNDGQVIVLGVERIRVEEPFNSEFTYVIGADGKSITGVAKDPRAKLIVLINGKTYQSSADLMGNFKITIPTLAHATELAIYAEYNEFKGDEVNDTFYKETAVLESAGQFVSGYAKPQQDVVVYTDRYGKQTVSADGSGIWKALFVGGLKNGASVVVAMGTKQLPLMLYVGISDITYSLTAVVVTPLHITGTAVPNENIIVQSPSNPSTTTVADTAGNWEVILNTALRNDEVIDITSDSDSIEIQYKKAELTVISISDKQISGRGQYGDQVSIQADGGERITADVSEQGQWLANFTAVLSNPTNISVSDSAAMLPVVYALFTAQAITSTQIEGIAPAGSTVKIGALTTISGANHHWKMILLAPLAVGETVQATNNGSLINVTFQPDFTAYIGSDGLSILGTSSQAQVTVTVAGVDTVEPVANGQYQHVLSTALAVGEVVTVQSGGAMKTVTYTGLTAFTATLSAGLDAVTGNVDAPAKIRAVFTDNSISEIEVQAGDYTLNLGRILTVGTDTIVVACIANNALYQSKTLLA